MRLSCCLLLAGMVHGAHPTEEAVIEVFVPPVQAPMTTAFFQAQAIATRIFSDIGTTLKWRQGSQATGCAKRPWRIEIGLTWETPAGFRRGSLALAQPFASGSACITIFVDRVQSRVGENPALTTSLLAHVLAHEIAHILRGTDSHSESGILKASWSNDEIRSMGRTPLRFTELDVSILLDSVGRQPPPQR